VNRRQRVVGLLGVALLVALVFAQPAAADQQPAQQQAPGANWVVTLSRVPAYSAPSSSAVNFGTMPAMTTLQVLDYQNDWAHVVDPRSKSVAYVQSDQLGPGDPPPPYVFKPAPKLTDEFSAPGVVTDDAPMAMYPIFADDAVDRKLYPNTWLTLTGQITADDGSTWYRTDGGDYVPTDAVFVPERADAYTGHWLDVDISTPARVTAYEGDQPVDSFLTIIGAGPRPTPTGVFTILRRVANETMNSDTIGIPRFGPGGYYLTNVLFTQYFTDDGASLHYNYWSSSWGYPGSHGCLGLTYADSSWLWGWGHLGMPVVIHR
jgi:lipoprotein-anchoring transpeptidase ErfK/SrfK